MPIGARRTTRGARFVIAIIALLTVTVTACGRAPMKPQRIENASGLQKFFATLHNTQEVEATTRIIHYGDSHVAADWLTGRLRRNFQQDFGQGWVRYEAKGINGARATKPLGWDWDAMGGNFTNDPPTLIVVAYGTNEAGDTDLDLREYKNNFSLLLQRFKAAAPDASLLVLAPPDRARLHHGKWHTLASLPALIETQRAAALTEGAAFWNQFAALGGAGAINDWAQQLPRLAQKDRVHLTLAGYELIADALYAELMREYEIYHQQLQKD